MPDFSQNHIKKQIAAYLHQQGRDPQLIAELTGHGFCRGFTTLNLYAKWLETQPVRKDNNNCTIPRDDFIWLTHALTTISTWDIKKPLTPNEQNDFEHVLAKINAYQGKLSAILHSSQSDFHLTFSDTRDRICVLEYDLTIRFTAKELMACLGELLPPDKLIFLSSNNHSMGIFKHGDAIFYIDPNMEEGMSNIVPIMQEVEAKIIQKMSNKEHLGEQLDFQMTWVLPVGLFFYSSDFDTERPSPISIQIFNIQNKNDPVLSTPYRYPPRECFLEKSSILKQLFKPSASDYAGNETELHSAVSIGNKEIIAYILKQPIAQDPAYLEQKDIHGGTALMYSIIKQDIDIITTLLTAGSNPNAENNKGITPLNFAIQFFDAKIVTTLVNAGANVNHLNKTDDLSPLSVVAIMKNRLEMIPLLLEKGADINLENSSGMTALAMLLSIRIGLTTRVAAHLLLVIL